MNKVLTGQCEWLTIWPFQPGLYCSLSQVATLTYSLRIHLESRPFCPRQLGNIRLHWAAIFFLFLMQSLFCLSLSFSFVLSFFLSSFLSFFLSFFLSLSGESSCALSVRPLCHTCFQLVALRQMWRQTWSGWPGHKVGHVAHNRFLRTWPEGDVLAALTFCMHIKDNQAKRGGKASLSYRNMMVLKSDITTSGSKHMP